jgi:hypothetical protein
MINEMMKIIESAFAQSSMCFGLRCTFSLLPLCDHLNAAKPFVVLVAFGSVVVNRPLLLQLLLLLIRQHDLQLTFFLFGRFYLFCTFILNGIHSTTTFLVLFPPKEEGQGDLDLSN